MTEVDYLLGTNEDTPPPKLTAIDYTSRMFIPALSIIATIVVGGNSRHPAILYGLIAVTAISLMVGPFQWMLSAIRAWRSRVKDERIAGRYFPALRKLVHRFGDFINGTRADTLHNIAESYLCDGHGDKIAKLGMPNLAAWSGRWDLFSRRLDQQKPGPKELQYAVLEFHDMVGTYTILCAAMVFGRLPQDMLAAMTPRAKSELGGFQQRYERFLGDSEQLLKEISASCRHLGQLPHSFAPVRPLA
jgi:hypothetical protein